MTAAVASGDDFSSIMAEVIDKFPNEDPWFIAREITARTPDEVIRESYTHALVSNVRIALASRRNNAINRSTGKIGAPPQGHGKVRRVREYWQRVLDTSIPIDNGESKVFRDCTAEDLAYAIKSRLEHIASVQAKVDYYGSVIAKMNEEGVDTVGELSGPP